jgi:hypothetical protein
MKRKSISYTNTPLPEATEETIPAPPKKNISHRRIASLTKNVEVPEDIPVFYRDTIHKTITPKYAEGERIDIAHILPGTLFKTNDVWLKILTVGYSEIFGSNSAEHINELVKGFPSPNEKADMLADKNLIKKYRYIEPHGNMVYLYALMDKYTHVWYKMLLNEGSVAYIKEDLVYPANDRKSEILVKV